MEPRQESLVNLHMIVQPPCINGRMRYVGHDVISNDHLVAFYKELLGTGPTTPMTWLLVVRHQVTYLHHPFATR
jgi:hypothetical protein